MNRTFAKPIHRMSERPACPRCGQPVMVVEIEDPSSTILMPVEQQILCPQCGGYIAALMSLKRVLAYPAPVGDYHDETDTEASDENEILRKPIENAARPNISVKRKA